MRQVIVIVIVIVFIAVACGSHRHQISENKLEGRWSEHWGKDSIHPETDVAYVDTITMLREKNGLGLRCAHNPDYVYDQIRIKDDSIFFRMQNTSVTEFDFFINYRLKQVADGRLEGRIDNTQNETVSVVLQKLPPQ